MKAKVPKFTGVKWSVQEHANRKAAKEKIKGSANPNAKDIADALGLR